ncbi:MAG: response regulator transcription factor [Chloroflexi bacterium]|nr:response regulator transcription factor [Chloroflexota bacterium]
MTGQPRANILCIEDEADMIELIRWILERQGFAVRGALSGAEGLRLMREDRHDLVLLDIMMPQMDGWDVHREMKATPELEDVPVIVVTAKAQSIDRVLGLHIAKVSDYVTKPFGPQELVASVERVLTRAGKLPPTQPQTT